MDVQDSLQIYAHQQGWGKWRVFLSALVAEFDEIDPAEAQSFLQGMGTRIARSMPLPACNSVVELEHAMNAAWASMGWGAAELREGERYLRISHGGYPTAGHGNDGAWLVPVLEGAYTEWLNAVGGNTLLKARRVTGSVPAAFAPLTFDYGRYDH